MRLFSRGPLLNQDPMIKELFPPESGPGSKKAHLPRLNAWLLLFWPEPWGKWETWKCMIQFDEHVFRILWENSITSCLAKKRWSGYLGSDPAMLGSCMIASLGNSEKKTRKKIGENCCGKYLLCWEPAYPLPAGTLIQSTYPFRWDMWWWFPETQRFFNVFCSKRGILKRRTRFQVLEVVIVLLHLCLLFFQDGTLVFS